MIDIFNSIERIISIHRQHEQQNEFSWTLPRQIGATTWILERIVYDIKRELTVVLAGYRYDDLLTTVRNHSPILREAYDNKQLILIGEGSNFSKLCGRTINRVYGDNTIYWSKRTLTEFKETYRLALIRDGGYAVFINTTGGER